MTRYAVPLTDLDCVWRTPAGAALVETALDDGGVGKAEVVTVKGTDAVVLDGPEPRVLALVAGLVGTPLPAPSARTVRVFANDGSGWHRVTTPPDVPELPDEQPPDEGLGEAAWLPNQQPEGEVERGDLAAVDRSAPRACSHAGNELLREPDVSLELPHVRAVGAPVASLSRG